MNNIPQTTSDPQTTPDKPKKKSTSMRYFQLVILVGIVAAIYLSFNGNVLSTSPELPAMIGSFTLSHVDTGDKAIGEIRGMFGEEISYSKAFIAHYDGTAGGLTIRAGEKRDVADAEGAIDAVVAGIQRGEKKGYTGLTRATVEGRTVYSLKVNGMLNNLYQSGNKVMWVEIMEGDPSRVLADVIRAFGDAPSRPNAAAPAQPAAASSKGSAALPVPKSQVQTNEGGSVTIEVTWEAQQPSSNSLRLAVIMDTHSVDLDKYDMKKTAALRNDKGRQVAPAAWEGPPGGGHHRSGALVFPATDGGTPLIEPGTKYVELVIRDVASVKERVLRWDLESKL